MGDKSKIKNPREKPLSEQYQQKVSLAPLKCENSLETLTRNKKQFKLNYWNFKLF